MRNLFCVQTDIDLESGKNSLGILLGLFFDPEDGGDMFLRNGWLSTDYSALYPRSHCCANLRSCDIDLNLHIHIPSQGFNASACRLLSGDVIKQFGVVYCIY
jgi:hypothetical protein